MLGVIASAVVSIAHVSRSCRRRREQHVGFSCQCPPEDSREQKEESDSVEFRIDVVGGRIYRCSFKLQFVDSVIAILGRFARRHWPASQPVFKSGIG